MDQEDRAQPAKLPATPLQQIAGKKKHDDNFNRLQTEVYGLQLYGWVQPKRDIMGYLNLTPVIPNMT